MTSWACFVPTGVPCPPHNLGNLASVILRALESEVDENIHRELKRKNPICSSRYVTHTETTRLAYQSSCKALYVLHPRQAP